MTTTDFAPSRSLPWGANVLRGIAGDPYVEAPEYTKAGSAREALKPAGLDWTVEQSPLFTSVLTPDGVTNLEVPERYAMVGSHGQVVGIVGNGYTELPNFELAEFVDLTIDTGASSLAGMGATKDGGFGTRVWAVVKLDQTLVPPGMPDEAVDVFALFQNSFDGTLSLTASIVPFRLACVNGLRYRIKNHTMTWQIRHSSNLRIRMEMAQDAIRAAAGYGELLRVDMTDLLGIPISPQVRDDLVETLVPIPEPKTDVSGAVTNQATISRRTGEQERLRELLIHSPNLQNVKQTGWGLVNGFAEHLQWQRSYRLDPMSRLVRDVTTGTDSKLARARELVLARR